MSLQAIETRSIEDSLSHGHDALSRAEHLVSVIRNGLTGPDPSDEQNGVAYGNGVVSSADRLAGRAEALVRELERVRSRIVSDNPSVTKASDYPSNKYTQDPGYRA